jgi:hypothetical protein
MTFTCRTYHMPSQRLGKNGVKVWHVLSVRHVGETIVSDYLVYLLLSAPVNFWVQKQTKDCYSNQIPYLKRFVSFTMALADEAVPYRFHLLIWLAICIIGSYINFTSVY